MTKQLTWTRTEGQGVNSFVLKGTITETARLEDLLIELGPRNTMNVSGVDNINSTGVREWMRFIRNAEGAAKTIEFLECSSAFISQLNMIAGFVGRNPVRSVCAPFVCTGCDTFEAVVIELASDMNAQLEVSRACPACGDPLEFDDIPELFFSFAQASGPR